MLYESKEPESISLEEQAIIEKLKDIMAHGTPLNREHPGISNLTTEEVKKFDALQRQKVRVGG